MGNNTIQFATFVALLLAILFVMQTPGHQRAALPLHHLIIVVFGLLALACIAGGIFGIYLNAKSDTKLDILGAHLATGHVGVAFVGIGLFIAYFTVRAVLLSQHDLAMIPKDEPARHPTQPTQQPAAIYTSRPVPTEMESQNLSGKAFEVLKWFHTFGPMGMASVDMVATAFGLSRDDALSCIQELRGAECIYTVMQGSGEWNGQYSITLAGRKHVEKFGT